jgi:DNA repair photolyase
MGLYRTDRDAFASTLTSLDDKFSLKWERGAALPQDRMDTLKRFHNADIFTWVSLEPVLDVEATLQIIRETHEYVDFFKIGRVNYIGLTETTDWQSFTQRVISLCAELNVRHYIKKDLQKFLPAGYPNPKYIPQHR